MDVQVNDYLNELLEEAIIGTVLDVSWSLDGSRDTGVG